MGSLFRPASQTQHDNSENRICEQPSRHCGTIRHRWPLSWNVWKLTVAVAGLTGIIRSSVPWPAGAELVIASPINFGAFGVALFFLISGFVIPLSFQSYGRLDFLVARFFRIYPTY